MHIKIESGDAMTVSEGLWYLLKILQRAILRNSNCLTFEIDLETARGVNSTVWTRSRLSHEVGFNSYPNYFGVHNHVTT